MSPGERERRRAYVCTFKRHLEGGASRRRILWQGCLGPTLLPRPPRPVQQRPPLGSPCACAASHVTARLRPHLQPPASRLLRERPQLAAAPGQLRGMYGAGPAGLRRRACAARGDGKGSGDGGGCGDLGQVPRAPGAGAGDCLTWRGLGRATPGRPARAWRCGAGPPRPARG